jgi:ribosomal-protein-alanine N-acetyltransferase
MSEPVLQFEPLDESHADELYPEFSEAESFRYTTGQAPASAQALRTEFSALRVGPVPGSRQTWLNWAIREPATTKLVGALQATVFSNDDLWIGYRIVRSASGRGVATASVQWLLGELASRYPGRGALAGVDARNGPSLRVLEKCGFTLIKTEPAQIRDEPTIDHIFQYIL